MPDDPTPSTGEFSTRPWIADDIDFLWEMLFQSLHVPEGATPFPRSVLEAPAIRHYLEGFGSQPGDDAQVAVDAGGEAIGASFCRRLPADDPGYGFVAEDVPEVGMAVVAAWRGRGVGRRLLTELLARNPRCSLSVDLDNDGASRLYADIGFAPVEVVGTSMTMLFDAQP